MNTPSPDAQGIDRLIALMARLRAPDGCPWDREQTPASLKPQLLEEAYEVLEAIDGSNAAHLTEELGDLLLHVVFQAQIAREAGLFTFADVVQGIAEKLVRRHPHVFGSEKVADAAGTIALWTELKKAEKPERLSTLDGVPRMLPALMRAEAIQKKASRVGFDWPSVDGALAKVREEMAELGEELQKSPNDAPASKNHRVAEELGDLLFSLVNLSRHLKLDAEDLLTHATDKFVRRFQVVEKTAQAEGYDLKKLTLAELDRLWDLAKTQE